MRRPVNPNGSRINKAKKLLLSPRVLIPTGIAALAYGAYSVLDFVANGIVAPVIAYTVGAKNDEYMPNIFAWLITLYAAYKLTTHFLLSVAHEQQRQNAKMELMMATMGALQKEIASDFPLKTPEPPVAATTDQQDQQRDMPSATQDNQPSPDEILDDVIKQYNKEDALLDGALEVYFSR